MDKYTKLLTKLKTGIEKVGDIENQQRMINGLQGVIQCHDTNKKSPMFTAFIKDFFEYERKVELELNYEISRLTGCVCNFNPITYIKQKKAVNKLAKTFGCLNDFHVDFYKTYGFSLSERMSEIEDRVSS